jgi:hypothetical protein
MRRSGFAQACRWADSGTVTGWKEPERHPDEKPARLTVLIDADR